MNQIYRTDYMTLQHAVELQNWLTDRIRSRTGNPELMFPPGWMPETGLVCLGDNDRLLAGVAIYFEQTSPVAVAGWVVTNPDNSASVSSDALKLLLAGLPGYAKSRGAKHLLTYFGNRGINSILDNLGFHNGDPGIEQKYFNL